MFLAICGIVAVIVINAVLAWKFDQIAQLKGYDGYFWYCFVFGIAGYLMVVALPTDNTAVTSQKPAPPREEKKKNYDLASLAQEAENTRKKTAFDCWVCKKCGEKNTADEMYCKSCGAYR